MFNTVAFIAIACVKCCKVSINRSDQHILKYISFGKCRCVHTGYTCGCECKCALYRLSTIVNERDLGITFSADVKDSEQCGIAASKGSNILGLIRTK